MIEKVVSPSFKNRFCCNWILVLLKFNILYPMAHYTWDIIMQQNADIYLMCWLWNICDGVVWYWYYNYVLFSKIYYMLDDLQVISCFYCSFKIHIILQSFWYENGLCSRKYLNARKVFLQRGDELGGDLRSVEYVHECQQDGSSCGIWILMVIRFITYFIYNYCSSHTCILCWCDN